jgi:UDP-glucose 4-epimerase
MKIFVTGGAGYIGSHSCVELLEKGYDIVVADNLQNGSLAAIDGVKKISRRDFDFHKTDLRDEAELEKIFAANKFDCVIHFAGLKAVGESVAEPLMYYENNVSSTLNLCKMMKKYGVTRFIFSSSATVYSADNPMPLTEDAKLGASNPYGWTKFFCEQILRDTAASEKDWAVLLLRYANPVGAHGSGLIGENPCGIPNNLMPFIAQTAKGIHREVRVFGNDYPTPDGTGIRDYIHVTDLARGHVLAIDFALKNTGCEAFNLGTGKGASVFEVIKTFASINSIEVPYAIAPRRPGDIPTCFLSPQKAEKILGFKALKSLDDMCRDTWNYQKDLGDSAP